MQPKSTWIWYPGDLEIYIRSQVELRRDERGVICPPIWKLDRFFHIVRFQKIVNLPKDETVRLYVEGTYQIKIDSVVVYGNQETFTIPQGQHKILISVVNEVNVPAIYLQGESFGTDPSWQSASSGNIWCDSVWGAVGSWELNDPLTPPSQFALSTKEIFPENEIREQGSIFVDFGKETFGYVKLTKILGKGSIALYYGESKEEALACDTCDTFDNIKKDTADEQTITLTLARAMRYMHIVADYAIEIGSVSLLYEYLPVEYRGKFACDNETVNQIWDTSVYTLHLNTREFFLDGIKRDRWLWSGDAYQSYLMNYYSFFDDAVNRRTMTALKGKEPIKCNINGIMDYTFYWFISHYDYYLYTGDKAYIEQNYESMTSWMEFCINRTNAQGMMEGLEEDWVFVDWADMSKGGELTAEQILFYKSLDVLGTLSALLGKENPYTQLAKSLKDKIVDVFWDAELGGFIHRRLEGVLDRTVTKHPNIFAILFDFLTNEQIEQVKNNVLLNRDVPRIKTPYFRFYELAALCEVGEHKFVLQEMLDYWGGMLRLGATSFWEEYDPTLKDDEHYAMYGRPFGKSLCHAWGASPIYLLGKYFLGVKPLTAGYETYSIEPSLGDLKWMKGSVPTLKGDIEVYMDEKTIKVRSTYGMGYLRFKSANTPTISSGAVEAINNCSYEVKILPHQEYHIHYCRM